MKIKQTSSSMTELSNQFRTPDRPDELLQMAPIPNLNMPVHLQSFQRFVSFPLLLTSTSFSASRLSQDNFSSRYSNNFHDPTYNAEIINATSPEDFVKGGSMEAESGGEDSEGGEGEGEEGEGEEGGGEEDFNANQSELYFPYPGDESDHGAHIYGLGMVHKEVPGHGEGQTVGK
jgi:hypothetical protein